MTGSSTTQSPPLSEPPDSGAMLVFVDESGDPGKTGGPGCSKFFTITLVIFQDYNEAARTEARMVSLRKELRVPPGYEFHFSKMCDAWREKALSELGQFKWAYVTTIINKAQLYGSGFSVPDSFYKYTCHQAFQQIGSYLRSATVIIDKSGNRKFRDELKTYLRKRLNADEEGAPAIKKLKMEESHRNNLLQLADLVCGAVSRHANDPKDTRFLRLILPNQMSRRFWPNK